MLGFGSAQAAGLSELIAKKRYPKAIEVIHEQLKGRRRDPRLRRRLADVLVMAGRPKEAVPILVELAEDLALSGAAGQAIAILKRAQRVGPGQPEVEEQLAYLIAQEKAPSQDPWERAASAVEPPPPKFDDASGAAPSFVGDLEEISDEPEVTPPAPPVPAGDLLPEQDTSEPISPRKPETLSLPGADEDEPDEDEPDEDGFRAEILGLIEDVFSGRAKVEPSTISSLPVVETPLFPDFSTEELIEVIRGLELRSYEAGEIVVAEGQPGQSLFLLTSGSVRTYVRDAEGVNAPVRVLGEGDFFGEVSLLEGSSRTATVTAAGPCELLEIDQLTLGHIARKHPRVWNVVRSFYEERARSEAELAARGGASETKER